MDSTFESAKLVQYVVKRLRDMSRGPYKLTEAKSLVDVNSVEGRILAESGPAWVAFHTANKAAKSSHSFKGQGELARLIDDLSNQSFEAQRNFANELELALAMDDTTSPPVESTVDTSVRESAKRHCTYCVQ
jgi:hypothetical protein